MEANVIEFESSCVDEMKQMEDYGGSENEPVEGQGQYGTPAPPPLLITPCTPPAPPPRSPPVSSFSISLRSH